MNEPRSGLRGWQKVLLWALAAFVLWQLVMTDAVGNGLLGFFLGGEVPGTDIVLPPEVILAGTVGVAVLIVVVVVVRMWVGHRQVRKFRQQLPKADANTFEPKPEPKLKPVTVVATAAEPTKQVKKQHLQPMVTAFIADGKQLLSRAWQQLKPRVRQVATYARKAGGRFGVHAIGVYELVRMALIYGAKWSWRHSVIFAKWCGVWSRRITRTLQKRLGEFRHAVRPYSTRVAKRTTVVWQQTVQWLQTKYRQALKAARKTVASAKRAYRASPIPVWIASLRRKLDSGGQPKP